MTYVRTFRKPSGPPVPPHVALGAYLAAFDERYGEVPAICVPDFEAAVKTLAIVPSHHREAVLRAYLRLNDPALVERRHPLALLRARLPVLLAQVTKTPRRNPAGIVRDEEPAVILRGLARAFTEKLDTLPEDDLARVPIAQAAAILDQGASLESLPTEGDLDLVERDLYRRLYRLLDPVTLTEVDAEVALDFSELRGTGVATRTELRDPFIRRTLRRRYGLPPLTYLDTD